MIILLIFTHMKYFGEGWYGGLEQLRDMNLQITVVHNLQQYLLCCSCSTFKDIFVLLANNYSLWSFKLATLYITLFFTVNFETKKTTQALSVH